MVWANHATTGTPRRTSPEISRPLAAQLASLKGAANAYLRDPNYGTLRLRLEAAHSAVEAATIEARRILSASTRDVTGEWRRYG